MMKFPRSAPLTWLALCAVVSCGSVEVPTPRYYRLAALRLDPGVPTRSESLRVGAIDVAPHLDGGRLVAVYGVHRIDPSDDALWAAPLDRLVSNSIEQGLRDAGAFACVLDATDPSPADFELNGRLIHFERLLDAEGGAARATIALALRDERSGRVVWQGKLDETARIDAEGDAATVSALNAALAQAFSRFVALAEEEGGFRATPSAPRK